MRFSPKITHSKHTRRAQSGNWETGILLVGRSACRCLSFGAPRVSRRVASCAGAPKPSQEPLPRLLLHLSLHRPFSKMAFWSSDNLCPIKKSETKMMRDNKKFIKLSTTMFPRPMRLHSITWILRESHDMDWCRGSTPQTPCPDTRPPA